MERTVRQNLKQHRLAGGSFVAHAWESLALTTLLSVALSMLVASRPASADDLECVSTTFRMLSPNDKVCVSQFDDLKVPGVTCYISRRGRAAGASLSVSTRTRRISP
jgi:catabolite regulation protein CreA